MTTLPAVRGMAPDLPGDEFEVGYIAEDGTRHRVPLADAAVVRFEAMAPARRFNAQKGQRHLPGRWWSATDGRHVGYESWLERGLMEQEYATGAILTVDGGGVLI